MKHCDAIVSQVRLLSKVKSFTPAKFLYIYIYYIYILYKYICIYIYIYICIACIYICSIYVVTLYAFFLVNVTIYKFNNKTFKILLYFDFSQIYELVEAHTFANNQNITNFQICCCYIYNLNI